MTSLFPEPPSPVPRLCRDAFPVPSQVTPGLRKDYLRIARAVAAQMPHLDGAGVQGESLRRLERTCHKGVFPRSKRRLTGR
jgi:hypothetical protein